MKKAGEICAKALKKVLENVHEGVTCAQLDQIANRQIASSGATPSFMTVEGYKWTICTTINEQVVHAIPTDRKLASGDIIGIDIGALYEGFHSDLAISVSVGEVDTSRQKFLEVGKKTLKEAISRAKIGAHIGDISHTIQTGVEKAGYSVVESLTGHGVGRQLHEDPMVPGIGKQKMGPKLVQNMTIAIEIIYAAGSGNVVLESDGWTISTKDKSLAGLFEQTVAITKSGPIVLTPYL